MHPSQMTGLQLLQAMSHGDLPRASISETIPMTMDSIEAGTVHFTAQADKRHLNPRRWILMPNASSSLSLLLTFSWQRVTILQSAR